MVRKECALCGKKFKPKCNNQRFCGIECRKKVTSSTQKEQYQEKKETKKKKIKHVSLVEENQKAKELGMSYGEYQVYKYANGIG